MIHITYVGFVEAMLIALSLGMFTAAGPPRVVKFIDRIWPLPKDGE